MNTWQQRSRMKCAGTACSCWFKLTIRRDTQLNPQVNATPRHVVNSVLIRQGHHKHHGQDHAGTKMLHVQASMYRLDQAQLHCDDSIYYSGGRLAIMRLLTRRQLYMLGLTSSAIVRKQGDV